ncbi:MotA/TolQ/ExbB proton channel family protein [Notoacmeibacter marinus]|uniref:MotA/TolQ/ExbB proton channel family protein n=1 Tax=Notoacmeibacter marinus TaxID=1876515 RepID=UPI000DF310F4|nr:MotA/TolQ/ExbB proton channel family protein [Notoacmeibacter marinus]
MPLFDPFSSAAASLFGFLALGGPVVAVLLALSVIAMAVVIFKAVQFASIRIGRPERARKAIGLWDAGRRAEAVDHAAEGRSASAQAVARAMFLIRVSASAMAGNATHPRLSIAEIEEAVAQQANQRLHELRSGFRVLESIAQIAPLLGLFGTVLGMIEAFRKLQEAGNAVDPSILAGGIWVALLTTAVGLAVAMPTSLALTWLESRLDDERAAIEGLVSQVVVGRRPAPMTPSGQQAPDMPNEEGRFAT